MKAGKFVVLASLLLKFQFASTLAAEPPPSLALPAIGAHELRVITPTVLELSFVTTKPPDPAPITEWNFVPSEGQLRLPATNQLLVLVNGAPVAVKALGFKRRVLYAPLRVRDLRIGNWLYLELALPLPPRATVEVTAWLNALWLGGLRFVSREDDMAWSPAVHVNQTGYAPSWPKHAMIGYSLGNLGEAQLASPGAEFTVVQSASEKEVWRGPLKLRRDRGFPYESYQDVWEADFSALRTPGEYRLRVPGVGASFAFRIDEGIAAAFARTYALGLYHQRCGGPNALPFTRFTHGICHTAPAEVPDKSERFAFANRAIGEESNGAKKDPRHTAPQLKDTQSSLYPFVRLGRVDVRGGHHDAGDYSKYTLSSAQFVHYLMFAADVFPGVVELDNLGLPESGDGRSDVLQEAKWEADFLAKLQDDDGGFCFLVYPRDRPYELDVLPDRGDPQVVWPKTTAATAAGVAALAQCASSPQFKKQFPEAAALYLEKARKGWAFLERALREHGRDGAYQRISHYGDVFLHDDEIAWAACELFLATGEPEFEKQLIRWLKVGDPSTRRWSWWRLFEACGCAIRSYAFAAKAGKLKREQQAPLFLEKCEAEIAAAAEDQMKRAQACAYGTSFPEETKRYRTGGWYFPGDAAFDLATGMQLDFPRFNDPRPKFFEALIGNLNFEAGCNPVNVSFLTGLGWKRPREVVHQFALNDERALAPTGIPLGAIQASFGWVEHYGRELGVLSFPPDGDPKAPYPLYDRWGDSFNLSTEFVAVNQSRSLAYLAWLMAQSSVKTQAWRSGNARIAGLPAQAKTGERVEVHLAANDVALETAQIVWEAKNQTPSFGAAFTLAATNAGPNWIEAEAVWPDGRRVFAQTNFTVAPGDPRR